MFEGLIAFIEETLFTRITRILEDEPSAARRCEKILTLVLTFAEKNPGMTRLLTGDALQGETERLRVRISQLFDRLEAQIKQVLREAQIRENLKCAVSPTVMANLLMASTEGRLMQFVRSEFKKQPTEHWDDQWALLSREMLVTFA
jgi:TetR/AcrR family transcriptional regulator